MRGLVFLWGVIGLLGMGCASTGLGGMDHGNQGATGMVEDFDPLALNDEDLSAEDIRRLWMSPPPQHIPQPAVADGAPRPGWTPAFSAPDSGMIRVETRRETGRLGWRIQLSAHRDLGEAEEAVEEARRRFEASVYNEFEAPWYKVRIGDCRTEAEADQLLHTARRKGYTDAFKARTRIAVEVPSVE